MTRRAAGLLPIVVLSVVLLAAAGWLAGTSATSAPSANPSTLGSALPARLAASTGKALYVSLDGSNRSPGTVERPLRTIQYALDRARPGQRILVRAGLYEESLLFDAAGTESAPITLSAFGRDRPVVRPRPRPDDDTYGIRITSAYVRVRGFVFEQAAGMSSANVYVNDAEHVELRGNVIRRGEDQGIFTDDESSDVQIIGNVVYANGAGREGQHQSHGMYLQGDNHLVLNNLVYDHPYGFGIHIYPENDGTIVAGNTVAYSGWSGIVIGGGEVSDITIRNNIFAYNGRYGIAQDADEPSDSVIDTNLVWANGWGPVQPEFEGADLSGGNRMAAPRFVSPRKRDFHLTRRSPAVDRALPAYSRGFDLEGGIRPRGRAPDIGAFEWSRP